MVGYPLALIINDVPDTNLITLEKITITNMSTGEFSRTGDIVQLCLLGTKPVPKDSKIHDQAISGMESSLWASDEQLDRVRSWEATGHNRPNLPIVTIETDPNRPEVNSDGELQGYMWGVPSTTTPVNTSTAVWRLLTVKTTSTWTLTKSR